MLLPGTRIFIATTAVAVVILSSTTSAIAIASRNPTPDAAETLSNIPQMLSGDCVQGKDGDCKKARIQKPKSRQAKSCTRKCVTGRPAKDRLIVGGLWLCSSKGFGAAIIAWCSALISVINYPFTSLFVELSSKFGNHRQSIVKFHTFCINMAVPASLSVSPSTSNGFSLSSSSSSYSITTDSRRDQNVFDRWMGIAETLKKTR